MSTCIGPLHIGCRVDTQHFHSGTPPTFLPRNTQDARSTGRFSGAGDEEEKEEQDAEFFQELELLAGNSND